MYPDFLLRSKDDRPLLAVEVKGLRETDAAEAAIYRRNLLIHAELVRTPYFLLVLPERTYLWTDALDSLDDLPNYELSTDDVLKKYLVTRRKTLAAGSLSKHSLQMLVAMWLDDLTSPPYIPSCEDSPGNDWLVISGLSNKVKRAAIIRGEEP